MTVQTVFLLFLSMSAGVHAVSLRKVKSARVHIKFDPATFYATESVHCNKNGCLAGVVEDDIFVAESMCGDLIPGKDAKVCTGKELSEELFHQGQEHPLECLQENLPTFHAKMCQLCSGSGMDGVVSPSFDRNGTFCDARFKVLDNLDKSAERGDKDFFNVIHETIKQFDSYVQKYASFDEMVSKEDWQRTISPQTAAMIDVDSDGAVSLVEYRGYLNAIVLMGDMMPAALNGKDYIKDFQGFHYWAGKLNDHKFDWMGFFEVP